MACYVSATWHKLHSQQLARGKPHAISSKMSGQRPFSNKIVFTGMFFKLFFFTGTKIKVVMVDVHQ